MLAIVVYIIIPLLCFWGTKIETSQKNILTKDQTLIMRGIGMLFIIFTHMVKTNICTTTYFFYVSGVVGVALCFLVSGYGLHISFQQKNSYLEGFWKGKILRLLLPFLAAYLLYCAGLLFSGKTFTLSDVCGDLLTITIPGVTFWYLKIQLLLYIFFYVSYRVFSDVRNKIAGVAVFTILYICIAKISKLELFWYNSCLCFVFGLVLAEYQTKLLPLLRKKIMFIVSAGSFCLLYFVLYFWGRLEVDWLFDMIYMTIFCVVVIGAVQKIQGSVILKILGYYSIEVYLIHTVIGGYFDSTKPLSYILLPLVSVIIGIPVHQLSKGITDLINKSSLIKNV